MSERGFPYGRTIRVEGGLKARSARGAIGESWWSRRFLDRLETFAMGGRLARGRAYARAGQVLALEVAPGVVTATVQGSRPRPYAVRIALRPFRDAVWRTVEEALAQQAIYSARLLAGEMPHDIEDAFAAAGVSLFPAAEGDLTMRCSCPDWGVPCKHLAATFYLLAEAFDMDPFQILKWRGRDRDALLARLRELRGATNEETPPGPPRTPVAGAGTALAGLPVPALAPDRFWLPPVPLPARPLTLETETDLLLRQLPEPSGALGGEEFIATLRKAYAKFAEFP